MLVRYSELREERDLLAARALIAGFVGQDAAQIGFRSRMLAWIERYPRDAHLRSRREGHLTASALVVDPARGCVLLTHHKKLDRWLQLGGHCDGDANLVRVALREAIEESGIADLVIDPTVVDLDIHSIPARGPEPEHDHLDVRFLVYAPPHARETLSDESHALRWISPLDLSSLDADESVRRLVRLAFPRREGTPAPGG